MDENYSLQELVDKCDYSTKLAVTQWVMKHIVDHAKEGGSYRYLIYERLGFGFDAYVPLCDDGMTISNEFDLSLKDSLVHAFKNKDEKQIKKLLFLCDVENCFNNVSAGVPTNKGYRTVCRNHYKEIKNG